MTEYDKKIIELIMPYCQKYLFDRLNCKNVGVEVSSKSKAFVTTADISLMVFRDNRFAIFFKMINIMTDKLIEKLNKSNIIAVGTLHILWDKEKWQENKFGLYMYIEADGGNG